MKPESNQEKQQHQPKEEIDGGYYCTCHLCDSDYDSEYDSEYGSYSEYSSYSEWEDEEDGEEYDSDSAIEEEVWYDSDYFNENVYNMRPHTGWDTTSIPRNRYHLPESVLQNNENLNFYVNNRNGGGNNQTLQSPHHLLNAPNHSRQPTTSSSSTLVEENSTDDNRNYIPNRHATYPIPENGTNPTNSNSTGHNHRNGSHHMNSRNRRHGLRNRHPSHSNGHSNNGHSNNGHSNNNNDHNNDNDSDNDRHSHIGRSNTNNSQSPRRSKRKIFFSHFMFVIALISTLALVLFVQLFGYILTAADQARGVTLRLSNHNRQQPVCDNERTNTNEDENGESTARTNENPSSSIPNADPEVLFTEEIPERASRGNNNQHEEEKSETEEEIGTETESEEEKKEKEKKKEENEEDKEKNEFLAHLASLRAAQAMAGNPNQVNDPTRLNDPTRVNNPSQRLSSYLSNYVYYNSDIYSS